MQWIELASSSANSFRNALALTRGSSPIDVVRNKRLCIPISRWAVHNHWSPVKEKQRTLVALRLLSFYCKQGVVPWWWDFTRWDSRDTRWGEKERKEKASAMVPFKIIRGIGKKIFWTQFEDPTSKLWTIFYGMTHNLKRWYEINFTVF